MAITTKTELLHWNYFLALEEDLARISRFIEFDENNYSAFSIELAHLLLASASEVDVLLKEVCKHHGLKKDRPNIHDYRETARKHMGTLLREECFIPKYGMTLTPWTNWANRHETSNPEWWDAYNAVKHRRTENFSRANLKNALNALAALFSVNLQYYAPSRLYPHNGALPKPILFRVSQWELLFEGGLR